MRPLDVRGRACDADESHRSVLQQRLDRVRALFAASAVLDAPSATLGSIVLRPDQLEAVRRVRDHLRRNGGCLLADDVGTGKTYVALAVARAWTRPLVVVPASLRSTWLQAARRTDVGCAFVTHEALSRGRALVEPFDGVVVDESHRFRPTSRRHAALAELAARAPVLMLSATPMQNRTRELAAQLALFIGEAAYSLGAAQLTRWVVRSATDANLPLPRVRPPRWLPVDADDADVLREILALPPPPRAADAGDGGVLLQLSLVRAWASSRAALVASVQRRLRTLAAIEQCHLDGRLPTRNELRSWTGGGEVQLGFPTLLASRGMDAEQQAAMAQAIERERTSLAALQGAIGRATDPDSARAEALRAVRRAHPGESILAFSEFRSTVGAYWLALRNQPGVGMLSAREARIASGRVTRDDVLARFAPRAQGVHPPAAHERVTMLLTTDLLSEGVNLQDASVVVHLDLPWNPARLAQRLGRIRRPGGAGEVASYLMSPPARAALLLQAETRLRTKLARAERTIGRSVAVLPPLGAREIGGALSPEDESRFETATAWSAAELHGEIARRLGCWRSEHGHEDRAVENGHDITAAVRADAAGWIALLDDGRLIAQHAEGARRFGPSESPGTILRALELAAGAPRCVSEEERDEARREVDAWIALDWTQRSSGLDVADTPMRKRMRRALDDALGTVPRHRRADILRSAATVRDALTRPLPLGIERTLDSLSDARPGRADWIESAAAVVARAPIGTRAASELRPPKRRAVILFGDHEGA